MADTKTITFAGFEVKDEAKGEVAAKIATLEVIDKDGDIIRKSALPKGAKAAMSRWGHDAVFGERPVGKGPLIEKNGELHFAGKVFLKTTEGRETFETMKEMGTDQEWSFAFKVAGWENPSPDEKKQGAYRIITKMEPVSEKLFEVSPVLAGAGMGTHTTSLKNDKAADVAFTDAQRAEIKSIVQEAVKEAVAAIDAKAEPGAPNTEEPPRAEETPTPDETATKANEAARQEEAARKAAVAVSAEFERFQRTMRKVA
jgi:hypothetical protein